ncbi:MAG: hypothetical protein KIS78_02640 [Labilithrix sp.]|nr:hypothetical protein [Labilithrix sp.]
MPARPELVALYATAMADAGRKVSTIDRAVTAIAQVHRTRGIDWPRSHPAITEVMAGIRRRLGAATTQKAPVVDQKLVALLEQVESGLAGDRDRALLTLGCSVRSGAPSSSLSMSPTSSAAKRASS